MANRILWEDLTSLERAAILDFATEARDLWLAGKLKGMPFCEWLGRISEAIHETVREQNAFHNKK